MDKDILQNLFNKQKKLQEKLDNTNIKYNIQFTKNTILALIDEATETLREVPWKPWKQQQEWHKEKFKEEIIDIWHFLINLCLVADMNVDEVYNRYLNKNTKNRKRKDEGY